MITWDSTQRAVLDLDRARHASILGAPGTGKTRVLVEVFARALEAGDAPADLCVLSPTRLAAQELRSRIEQRVDAPLAGTPVRTAASLAFSVLARRAALRGVDAPRLLTGTVQDELIAVVVEEALADGDAEIVHLLAPEVLRSPVLRAELREFWRMLDDAGRDPAGFREELVGTAAAGRKVSLSEAPDARLLERWSATAQLLSMVQRRAERERPGEFTANGLLRAAASTVRNGEVEVPRLLLVDDAQDTGEGALALLAACASAGSAVWAFGSPDTVTSTFHGEPSRLVAAVDRELERRGAPVRGAAQRVVLATAHRHGGELRGFVAELARRLPSPTTGIERTAEPGDIGIATGTEPGVGDAERIVFAEAASVSEQIGIIAHRLREQHLGMDSSPRRAWSDMAVICRTRGDALRLARGLAQHQVPTGAIAGGIVLREHRIVRDLIVLLQDAWGEVAIDATTLAQVLQGPVGGLDPVAVRRLRGAVLLQERRAAKGADREARRTDDVLLEAFREPGAEPPIDSRGGRALRRLGLILQAGARTRHAGGTARETLWAIWDRTGLAGAWQQEALHGRESRADEANRSLDAVLGLFFALQRHEEQGSGQSVPELLAELLESAVPEDTLAQRAERDTVTISTPQGVLGREFPVTVLVGLQDGVWPNTKARGSLLGTVACERWLRGGAPSQPDRLETTHDELRLLVQAASRATRELLVVAVADDAQHPSPFFRFGREFLVTGLPSSRLTLRGTTASLRRRLVSDPEDVEAAEALAVLAADDVPGADPEEWYGVRAASTDAPLQVSGDPEHPIAVSPSQLETIEDCPLNWVVQRLGGRGSTLASDLGTLVHAALERAETPDPEAMRSVIAGAWDRLPFEAPWESQRTERTADEMVAGLVAYLEGFAASDRELLGRESGFSVQVGDAVLQGMADRLEAVRSEDGLTVTVIDLKTGRTAPSAPATERHVQLQAYQLGIETGAFSALPDEDVISGGATLLFVHPEAVKRGRYTVREQAPLDADTRAELLERVAAAARTAAGDAFLARVEHHCASPHQHGDCRLHIIPAVSHA